MHPYRKTEILFGICCFFLVSTFLGSAFAAARGITPGDTPSIYYSECSECHLAFPPDLLHSGSWEKIMKNLDEHFGSSAHLDDSTRTQLEDFLLHNSGTKLGIKRDGSDIRITQTLWFNRMHGKTKRYFSDSNIGSGSNCVACHVHATSGRYDENIIPANAEWFGQYAK